MEAKLFHSGEKPDEREKIAAKTPVEIQQVLAELANENTGVILWLVS
jgi:hypothetical protein